MTLSALTLSHNVYRRPAATIEVPAQGYLPIGSTIQVQQVAFGKELEGNAIWYQANDGFYYWSGGVNDIDFVQTNMPYVDLTKRHQFMLCQMCIRDYMAIWHTEFPELNVLAVNKKLRAGSFQAMYSIVFNVDQKLVNPLKHLPTQIQYKGFRIPTDVLEGSKPELCSLGVELNNGFGTAGFVAVRDNVHYLVTNFHVACNAWLKQGFFTLLETDARFTPQQREVRQGSVEIGQTIDGRMDIFTDVAKIKLTDPGSFSNLILGTIPISKAWDFISLIDDFEPDTIDVSMVGATTQKIITGKVKNLSASFQVDILLKGELVTHAFATVLELTLDAKKGDSGAPVWTKDNELVGIIVAIDTAKRVSYAISALSIESDFSITILPSIQ